MTHAYLAAPLRRSHLKRLVTALIAVCTLVATFLVGSATPAAAQATEGTPIAMSAGYAHSCAVGSTSELWCWGSNTNGRLGDGTTTSRLSPTLIRSSVIQVAAGRDHSCAVTSANQLYCWGLNDFGQLGDGTTTNRTTPTLVSLTGVAQVSVGARHTCARTTAGALYCWGQGADGRLGTGSTANRSTPTLVSLSAVTAVSAGFDHTCAIANSGKLYCFGNNDAGALGNGTTTDSSVPMQVTTFSSVLKVAAGGGFTCAVDGISLVACWGLNNLGQLGDGTLTNRRTPEYNGLDGAQSVTAGLAHACATTAQALCWGDNSMGQLGTGTQGDFSPVPVSVASLRVMSAVSAGGLHTCAVSTDSRGYCWGANGDGQLGDGVVTVARSTPQLVLLLEAPILVSPAANHTFAAGAGQSLVVSAPDSDVAYRARITIRRLPGGAVERVVETAADAGRQASVTLVPALPDGDWSWEAEWAELDESNAFSVPSLARGFSVAAAAEQPPGVPTQVTPAPGHAFNSEGQDFTITAVDPGGHAWTGELRIKSSTGAVLQTLSTESTASGSSATVATSPPLDTGTYRWDARACRTALPSLCSSYTGERGFTVQELPPETPVHVSPPPNYRFAEDGQSFTITALDRAGHDWTGEIRLLASGVPVQTLVTPSTGSGEAATVSANPPLLAGSYQWEARACRTSAMTLCSTYTGRSSFVVEADPPPSTPLHVSPAFNQSFRPSSQQFTITSIDQKGHPWIGEVRLKTSDGTLVQTLTTVPTASGSTATVASDPALPVGSYRWDTRACNASVTTRCSSYSIAQPFTVAEDPAPTPAQVSPAPAHTFGTDGQSFTMTAVDQNDHAWTGEVRIKTAAGTLVQSLETSSTASGGQATVVANPSLLDGSYKWDARACRSTALTVCSAYTAERSFGVSADATNSPPSAPEVVSPVSGHIFEPGEPQDFVLQARDPDGDSWVGMILGRETHAALSGMQATAYQGTAPSLAPGTYLVDVQARDDAGALSDTAAFTFGVAAPSGSPCQSSVPIVDGWFSGRYVRLATASVDDVSYICLRTAEGTSSFAGWVRGELGGPVGGGAPEVTSSATCSEPADETWPLLDQAVGPAAGRVEILSSVARSASTLTACITLKVASTTLLDHAVSLHAPDHVELTDVAFIPEASGWTPPMEVAPAVGLPSSECFEATTGKSRYINATVEQQHVWLYSQRADGVTRLCGRIESDGIGKGVVIREHAANTAEPITWVTGSPADDPAGPCPDQDWEFYRSDVPYHARLRTSSPESDPLALCLSAGLTEPTVAAWLTVTRSPDTGVTSFGVDP